MTDDEIKRVVYEHTKLSPNQADDQVLLDGIVRAVRQIQAGGRSTEMFPDAPRCVVCRTQRGLRMGRGDGKWRCMNAECT